MSIDQVEWEYIRKTESGGFMAKRLILYFLAIDMVLFGNSFCVDYGKFQQYLNPKDVVLYY